jgi:hypothetical protein
VCQVLASQYLSYNIEQLEEGIEAVDICDLIGCVQFINHKKEFQEIA